MEQLIVFTIFAICAAVCVQIISVAHAMTRDATDTRHALIAAENTAESFKAFGGNATQMGIFLSNGDDSLFGDEIHETTYSYIFKIFYCENWRLTTRWDSPAFSLLMGTYPIQAENQPYPTVILANILITRLADGKVLVDFNTAARPTRTANAYTSTVHTSAANTFNPSPTLEGVTP